VSSAALAQIEGNPQLQNVPTVQSAPLKSAGKIDPALAAVQSEYTRSSRRNARGGFQSENPLLQIAGDRIIVDIVAQSTNVQSLRASLEAAGMQVTGVFGRVISGWLPVGSIPALQAMPQLRYAKPALKPHTQVGVVTSQGDSSLRSNLVRRRLGIDGLGFKIGVLSDSYDNLGGAQASVLTGDLPGPGNPNHYRKPVQVLEDLPSGGSDEGRGMLELIHDVAPGAELAYHTAFTGQAGFANGILRLAEAGCHTIVDDVIYFAEPFFQDGIIAQAADSVNRAGVNYFSSAGNQGRASYESPYRPSNVEVIAGSGTAHNFSAPGDEPRYTQPISIPQGGTFICSFQWDDSFFSASGVGAETDMDILLLNSQGQLIAGGTSDNIRSGDPVEVFGYTNTTASTTFFLVLTKFAGPDPQRLKYINFGDGAFLLTTPAIPGILSSTLVGHANSEGAIAVGASAFFNTPAYGVNPAVINGFSALGGTPILRGPNGEKTFLVRQKPELVGPDGTNTSFFGNDIPQDADNFPNFFGTSASAPHVAAVTALIREAARQPIVMPQVYKAALIGTAEDMDDPNTPGFDVGFDFRTGFGFVNAERAVQQLSLPHALIANLQLTSVCSDQPDVVRRWRIRNPNPFEVRVTWEVYQTGQKDVLIAPPGDSFFTTATVSDPNTTIISWIDENGRIKKNTKASNPASCRGARMGDESLATSDDAFEMLTAYPNPSNGQFRLLFLGSEQGSINVEIYDGKGQQVYNRIHTVEENNSEISVDASQLPGGLYMLRVAKDDKLQTLKLIKQ